MKRIQSDEKVQIDIRSPYRGEYIIPTNKIDDVSRIETLESNIHLFRVGKGY